MPERPYEIRICKSCGLRYPFVTGQPFGTRCPACMGETHVALHHKLRTAPERANPPTDFPRERRVAVLLDNIRSAWNVGSILRSADGFGFSQAYLCGISPTPENEAVTKTSLGAEDSVPWSYHKDAVKLVKGLRKMGNHIYALEEHPGAMELGELASFPSHSILIVGNEITGVDPGLQELCEQILFIPMRGEKKSFNVAIAFGIAAYALSTK
ncbi:MAG: TrmH family RNA methyltransferase [Syntrophothermus sp.]